MRVTIVKDGDYHFMGVEIETDIEFYFISARQDLWPGIRFGKFPKRSDGTDFERAESVGDTPPPPLGGKCLGILSGVGQRHFKEDSR